MDVSRFMKGQIWTYEPHSDITKQRNPLLGDKRLMMLLSTKVGLKGIPITTSFSDNKFAVNIGTKNKLYALCDQPQTIEFKDLRTFYGQLSDDKIHQISSKVRGYLLNEITPKKTNIVIQTLYDERITNSQNPKRITSNVSLFNTLDEDAKIEFLNETIINLSLKYDISQSTIYRYRRLIRKEREVN